MLCTVVVVGALGAAFAFMAGVMQGPLIQIGASFFGLCGSPIIGLFVAGGSFKFVNWIVSVIKFFATNLTLFDSQYGCLIKCFKVFPRSTVAYIRHTTIFVLNHYSNQ